MVFNVNQWRIQSTEGEGAKMFETYELFFLTSLWRTPKMFQLVTFFLLLCLKIKWKIQFFHIRSTIVADFKQAFPDVAAPTFHFLPVKSFFYSQSE